MQSHFFSRYEEFDPFLGREPAEQLVALCEEFGDYGLYSEAVSYTHLPLPTICSV